MVAAGCKAMFEAEARARQGARTDLGSNSGRGDMGRSNDKAAALCGVSPRSVESASKVLARGVPALVQAGYESPRKARHR